MKLVIFGKMVELNNKMQFVDISGYNYIDARLNDSNLLIEAKNLLNKTYGNSKKECTCIKVGKNNQGYKDTFEYGQLIEL